MLHSAFSEFAILLIIPAAAGAMSLWLAPLRLPACEGITTIKSLGGIPSAGPDREASA